MAEERAEEEAEQREVHTTTLVEELMAIVAEKEQEIAAMARGIAERDDTIAEFSSREHRPLRQGSAILLEQTKAANPEQLVSILHRDFLGDLSLIRSVFGPINSQLG